MFSKKKILDPIVIAMSIDRGSGRVVCPISIENRQDAKLIEMGLVTVLDAVRKFNAEDGSGNQQH